MYSLWQLSPGWCTREEIFMWPIIDDQIVTIIRQSGLVGVTSLEIERALWHRLGSTTHQTVTGNLRHLVENNVVVHIALTRHLDGASRRVYVTLENYNQELHGDPVHTPRRARQPCTDSHRDSCRRKVTHANPDSALSRIRTYITNCPDGLTCRELETYLGMSHQTVSARLVELRVAGVITKQGSRILQGERRSQSVYFANSESNQERTLFDGL